MIAHVLAFSTLFASADPAVHLRDLPEDRVLTAEPWITDVPLMFRPRIPPEYAKPYSPYVRRIYPSGFIHRVLLPIRLEFTPFTSDASVFPKS